MMYLRSYTYIYIAEQLVFIFLKMGNFLSHTSSDYVQENIFAYHYLKEDQRILCLNILFLYDIRVHNNLLRCLVIFPGSNRHYKLFYYLPQGV